MKNNFKLCLLALLSVILSQTVYSQKTYYLGKGDSLYNSLPVHRGKVQWQYSNDNGSTWNNYQGSSSTKDNYGVSISGDIKIRAKVTEGTCDIYSDTTSVYTTVSDYDGNKYKVKKIGKQVWMTENLRTSYYSDGNVIPLVSDNSQWKSLQSDAYCYRNNDKDSSVYYGFIYNGYAAIHKNLCPQGWIVPASADWEVLSNYLIAKGFGYGGSGDEIAKSLSAVNLAAYQAVTWTNSTVDGAPGNNVKLNNYSGFNGLPIGYRDENGNYGGFSLYANWWVNYVDKDGYSKGVTISYDQAILPSFLTNITSPNFGMSVRCIKQ